MTNDEKLREELAAAKLACQMGREISQFQAGFLARIAHELRAPLSSLMGIHQIILSELCESQPEERTFIAQAYEAAQKLMKVIDEIITISKIEYGAIALTSRPVSLVQVLRDLERLTHLQAANRHFFWEMTVPSSEVLLLADPERFLQGLVILVDTAIWRGEGGTIKVISTIDEIANLAHLKIQFPASIEQWQSTDFSLPELPLKPTPEAMKAFSETSNISPSLKFILVQKLFKKMTIDLELSPGNSPNIIELQARIPLAISGIQAEAGTGVQSQENSTAPS